jgi:hypothetical protein
MQLVTENIPPFSASVNQVFKDNKVINMAGTVLRGKIRQKPNKSDVNTEKNCIAK